MERTSASSTCPIITTTPITTPNQRDKVLAITTVAIAHVRSSLLMLNRASAHSVADLSIAVNGTNANNEGDLFVQKDILCHGLKLCWKKIKAWGWDRSQDSADSCRGEAIGSFIRQGSANYSYSIPVAADIQHSENGTSDGGKTNIITVRNILLRALGIDVDVAILGGLSSLFPLAESVQIEIEKMKQLTDYLESLNIQQQQQQHQQQQQQEELNNASSGSSSSSKKRRTKSSVVVAMENSTSRAQVHEVINAVNSRVQSTGNGLSYKALMKQFDGKIWDSIDDAVTRDLRTVSSLSSELFYATLSISEQEKLSDAKNDGVLERLIDGQHLKALDYMTERSDDFVSGQFNVRLAVALRRKQFVVSRIIEDLAHARNQNCPLEWTAATSTVLEQGNLSDDSTKVLCAMGMTISPETSKTMATTAARLYFDRKKEIYYSQMEERNEHGIPRFVGYSQCDNYVPIRFAHYQNKLIGKFTRQTRTLPILAMTLPRHSKLLHTVGRAACMPSCDVANVASVMAAVRDGGKFVLHSFFLDDNGGEIADGSGRLSGLTDFGMLNASSADQYQQAQYHAVAREVLGTPSIVAASVGDEETTSAPSSSSRHQRESTEPPDEFIRCLDPEFTRFIAQLHFIYPHLAPYDIYVLAVMHYEKHLGEYLVQDIPFLFSAWYQLALLTECKPTVYKEMTLYKKLMLLISDKQRAQLQAGIELDLVKNVVQIGSANSSSSADDPAGMGGEEEVESEEEDMDFDVDDEENNGGGDESDGDFEEEEEGEDEASILKETEARAKKSSLRVVVQPLATHSAITLKHVLTLAGLIAYLEAIDEHRHEFDVQTAKAIRDKVKGAKERKYVQPPELAKAAKVFAEVATAGKMNFQRTRFQRGLLWGAVVEVGTSLPWSTNSYTKMLQRMLHDKNGQLGTSSYPFIEWTSFGKMCPLMEALPQILKTFASHPLNYLTARECAWQNLQVASWKDHRQDVFPQIGGYTRDLNDALIEYSNSRDSRKIKSKNIITFPGTREAHIGNFARQDEKKSHKSVLGTKYKIQKSDSLEAEAEDDGGDMEVSDSDKGEAQRWSERFHLQDSPIRPLIMEIAEDLVKPLVEEGAKLTAVVNNTVLTRLFGWYDLADKRFIRYVEATMTDLVSFLEKQKKKEEKLCGVGGSLVDLPRDAFTHLIVQQNGNALKKVLKVATPSLTGISDLLVAEVRRQLVTAFGRDVGVNQVPVGVAMDAFRTAFAVAKDKSKNMKSAMDDIKDEAFDDDDVALGGEVKVRSIRQALDARPRGAQAKALFDFDWDRSKEFPFL